jgi:hypothetical protein
MGSSPGLSPGHAPLLVYSEYRAVYNVTVPKTRISSKVRVPIHPRKDWDAEFAKMATCGDDVLLDAPVFTEWDETEPEMKPKRDPLAGKKTASLR